MKRRSFFLQLYFVLIVLIIIPIIIVSYISLSNTLSYSEDKIAETSLFNVQSISKTNEIVLFNVIKNILRLTQSGSFKGLRGLDSYEEINSEFATIQSAMDAASAFSELLYNDSSIHSIYFLRDNADYVVSSDKGITKLDGYRDTTWVKEAVKEQNSIRGFWLFRKIKTASLEELKNKSSEDYQENCISYVYSLKTLASSIKGTFVVNIYEEKLNNFINPSEIEGSGSLFIVDEKNQLIVHPDKQSLGKNVADSNYMKKIEDMDLDSSFFFQEVEGERYLYTFSKSDFNQWTYISVHSMKQLMTNVKQKHNQLMILIALIVISVIAILLLIVYKMLRPMKDLVNRVSNSDLHLVDKPHNELLYLSNVFNRIQEESKVLNEMLLKNETDVQRFALRELINGEQLRQESLKELQQLFAYKHFIVCLVSFDNKDQYLSRYNAEEIKYFRYWIHEWVQVEFEKEGITAIGVRYSPSASAIIINIEEYDEGYIPKLILKKFEELQKEINKKISFTVSVGVSLLHLQVGGVVQCLYEAGEALKNKLTVGQESIIFWKPYMNESKQYFYPYNSEERITNHLSMGNVEAIQKELFDIRSQILSYNHLAYDNILLIYNQLVGATIKYLVENNLNSGKIFGHYNNVYSTIAEKDTIESIELFLTEFYQGIINYMSQVESPIEVGHSEKIVAYLNEHYKEDFMFENMASELAISYSYMRKIIKDATGMSLIDCLNSRRIEEAKRILLQTNDSIEKIALEIGYNNVQSFNRYFKKFEGISAGKYRDLNNKIYTC